MTHNITQGPADFGPGTIAMTPAEDPQSTSTPKPPPKRGRPVKGTETFTVKRTPPKPADPVQCRTCGKWFGSKENLLLHRDRAHSGRLGGNTRLTGPYSKYHLKMICENRKLCSKAHLAFNLLDNIGIGEHTDIQNSPYLDLSLRVHAPDQPVEKLKQKSKI